MKSGRASKMIRIDEAEVSMMIGTKAMVEPTLSINLALILLLDKDLEEANSRET
jgi:hypothetical protein